MNIPAATVTDNSLFPLQTERDFLTTLQVQPSEASVNFNKVLESTGSITDTVQIGTVSQAATLDPTSSALFQAHSGAFSASQALAGSSALAQTSDQSSQLRVTGISAAAATGPFANGQTPQAEDFQARLSGLDETVSSQYPAVTGPSDFTNTYDSLRSAGRMNPPIGTQVDLKG